ncbi:EF-hand domain-containing protein [Acidovorax sp. LjRoot129]|uniref:EF-hand domain-containing protein n=1 Tax=Acidovorax sp. LjRoot129 TaxID=3342260 RepID=UPI003F5033CF
MRNRISLVACAVGVAVTVVATVTPAVAQTPAAAQRFQPAASAPAEPQAGLTKGEVKAMRDFKMLDFDGDGKLSRSEVKLFPRLAAAFEDADTDRDGYVSYEEVRVFAGKYRAERDRNKAAQAAANAPASAAKP